MEIIREELLELTRRMTLTRNCFSRIAGAYFDEEGFMDGTFNQHFLKLSKQEQEEHIKIAKTIPFADTNKQIKNILIPDSAKGPGKMSQLLAALKECELKNDALLYDLYEYIGDRYQPGYDYSVLLFYGAYDIPQKGTDKQAQWESDEVYTFLIGALCPLKGDYESGIPAAGFLYPAFIDRGASLDYIQVFDENGNCERVRDILFR